MVVQKLKISVENKIFTKTYEVLIFKKLQSFLNNLKGRSIGVI